MKRDQRENWVASKNTGPTRGRSNAAKPPPPHSYASRKIYLILLFLRRTHNVMFTATYQLHNTRRLRVTIVFLGIWFFISRIIVRYAVHYTLIGYVSSSEHRCIINSEKRRPQRRTYRSGGFARHHLGGSIDVTTIPFTVTTVGTCKPDRTRIVIVVFFCPYVTLRYVRGDGT